ncbi:MAG: zinc ribbon domain-containing protein [bacterium]|nr:zinc ribbon domain-containing protein [bacterium]
MDKSTFLKLLFAYIASVVVVVGILSFTVDVTIKDPDGSPSLSGPVIIVPLVMVALFMVFLMIGIGIAVHRDARKRGMEAPLVWALVAGIVPYFLGLIVYLIIRKPIQALCDSCGNPLGGTESFCPHCGQSLRASCSSCDRPVHATARFCPHCGVKLAVQE